jgi:hypothetical protein
MGVKDKAGRGGERAKSQRQNASPRRARGGAAVTTDWLNDLNSFASCNFVMPMPVSWHNTRKIEDTKKEKEKRERQKTKKKKQKKK